MKSSKESWNRKSLRSTYLIKNLYLGHIQRTLITHNNKTKAIDWPIKKMAKVLNRHLTKGKMQLANSTWRLSIMIVSHHRNSDLNYNEVPLHPVRTADVNRNDKTRFRWGHGNGDSHAQLVEARERTTALEPSIWTFLMESSTCFAWTRHPFLGIYSKKMKIYVGIDTCMRMFISNFCTKNGKQCQSPSSGEWSNKGWCGRVATQWALHGNKVARTPVCPRTRRVSERSALRLGRGRGYVTACTCQNS